MVDVAQLVEPRIVIPAVVGSSPIAHPILMRQIGLRVRPGAGAEQQVPWPALLSGYWMYPGTVCRSGTSQKTMLFGEVRRDRDRSPILDMNVGLLAQLVEQLTLNQLVIGSSPIRPTTFLG